MVRDVERDRDRFASLLTAVEAFLKQGREAHATGFRRHQDTWRRALFHERNRNRVQRDLRWGPRP